LKLINDLGGKIGKVDDNFDDDDLGKLTEGNEVMNTKKT